MSKMEGSYRNGLRLGTGVWTPRAEVLCARCIKTMGLESHVHRAAVAEVRERRDGWELQGWCTSCGDQVWVDNKIANEQRMINVLINHGIPARLQQTGGMCSAVEAWAPNDKLYVGIFASEESVKDYGENWDVGVFSGEHGEPLSDGYDNQLTFEQAVDLAVSLYASISHISRCAGTVLDESQI